MIPNRAIGILNVSTAGTIYEDYRNTGAQNAAIHLTLKMHIRLLSLKMHIGRE